MPKPVVITYANERLRELTDRDRAHAVRQHFNELMSEIRRARLAGLTVEVDPHEMMRAVCQENTPSGSKVFKIFRPF